MSDSKTASATDKSDKDFEWAIGLNRVMLSVMGLWPSDVNTLQRNYTVPAMVAWILIFLTTPMTYALYMVRRRLPLVADNLNVNLNTVVSCIKLHLLWKGRDVIESLLIQMWNDWVAEKSIFETRMMQLQAGRARIITTICCCLMSACLTIHTTLPILHISIRSLNNITDFNSERFMPIQTYYPYDAYREPIYELTYFQLFIAASFMALAFTVPENFFAAVVLHACAQCQIVEKQIEQLANCSTSVDRFQFVRRLGQVVENHTRLIRFVCKVEDLFSYLILAHVLFLTVVIGCFGFSLMETFDSNTESKDYVRLAVLTGTAVDLMFYTLIYCGAGELLTSNSSRIHSAAYQSNFQSLPKNCARDFIIVMVRSQTPLTLTAGQFFPLTLNTYLQLVKKSFGYISVLLTVYQ